MKKLLLIAFLMLALVITAVACTETPDEPDTSADDVTTVESPTEAPDEPDTPAPDTDEPETPAPDTDEPETPAPDTNEPETPAPETDEPETPEPETADPADPVWIIDADGLAAMTNANAATVEKNEAGYASFTATAGDPWFLVTGNIGEMPEYLVMRYRTNTTQQGEFFIGNGTGPVGGESFLFNYNANSEWNLLIFHLPTVASYMATPTVGYIRFDFYTAGPEEGAFLDVEYIAFFNTAEYAQAYDFEMHKAPMWDADKSVVAHQSFDQFFYGDGSQDDAAGADSPLNLYHAANKPDWDKVADMVGSEYTCLTYWGWIATKSETIGQFGYQVGMNAPIFDDAWTHTTEQGVLEAAAAMGGVTGSRMKIRIDTADFDGETLVRVLYKDADGNVVCLNEVTVIAPVKAKDITNTFTSDFASQTVDTPINSTDLAGAFTPMLNLGDYKTLANGYKLDGISELFADVNGKYALTVNFAEGRNGNYYAFARGVHAVETNATEGVNFTIKNFYETDGTASDMGGAGIYARIEGTDLKIMIKTYDAESNIRIKNVYYTLPCTGTTLTLADDSETVYILVDGVTYATVTMSGETEYDGFANVSPATTFAKTAVVTLIDGTTETLTDTLIDSTCDTQTGLVVRSGSFVFDVLNLTAFSAVENPGFGTDEPEEPQNVVIDIASVEGYKASNNYGYDCPIIDIGYNEVYLLGNFDLNQYSQIIIEYSYDGDSPNVTDRTPEQCWTDAGHAPIIGFTALDKCFGYADVTNQDAIDNGIYTEIPYTTGNWAAATRTATIEIPENIGYNGPCYLSAYNPWGRTIAVVSITLVPRA